MQYRKLGRSGLKVSPLCLGTMQFGWSADQATAFDVMDAFIASGANFIDTADIYSAWIPGNHGGESETIIGRWLKSAATATWWCWLPSSTAACGKVPTAMA
jgi:aryl-alcohol dehydrogenase-like predicted oxidoreductase